MYSLETAANLMARRPRRHPDIMARRVSVGILPESCECSKLKRWHHKPLRRRGWKSLAQLAGCLQLLGKRGFDGGKPRYAILLNAHGRIRQTAKRADPLL